MSVSIRIILAVFAVLFLAYVLRLVARGKLLLKYSLLWLILGIAMLLCAAFPGVVIAISKLSGFITSSNFVFLIAIGILLAISLSLSVVVSRQLLSIKNLTHRLALLEKEQRDFD